MNTENNDAIVPAGESDYQVYESIRQTLEDARRGAARTVNNIIVQAYWDVGRQIHDAVGERAAYGKSLLKYLSEQLTADFGKGFDVTNLRNMRQFYLAFPIRDALRRELSWSHYRRIMRVDGKDARTWYMNEAADAHWNERELGRQIATSLYERLLSTQEEKTRKSKNNNERVDSALHQCTNQQAQPMDPAANVFKEPYVLEFVGLDKEPYLESDLEQALIDSLQDFLLELGNGFAFVGRQQRVTDGEDDYYIDLVFYNYLLNCFVLIDLKTGKLDPRDVGQMDFYRRLYDDQYRPANANPTVAIILCAKRNETVAKYSALADGNALLAAEYLTRLPSEEDLVRVVERNRREFEARHEVHLLEESDSQEGSEDLGL